jgi:hypothetical protein
MTSLDPTPFFQKYGPSGNAWAIFKTYLDAAAQQAAAPIVDKYLGKLAEQTCSLSITPSRCSSHRALTPAYWAHSGSGHRSTGDAHPARQPVPRPIPNNRASIYRTLQRRSGR